MKNYYLILGVEPASTAEEIKAAYRKGVKNLHPDYYGEDQEPFLALQEAYDVLSDPVQRRKYDQSLHPTRKRGRRYGRVEVDPLYGGSGVPPSRFSAKNDPFSMGLADMLDSIFGQRLVLQPTRPSLRATVHLTPLDARRGGRVRLLIPVTTRCVRCGGWGGHGGFLCPTCRGAGVVQDEFPIFVAYPPGLVNNHSAHISLQRYGLPHDLELIFKSA